MSYKVLSRKKQEKENDILFQLDEEIHFLRALQNIQWIHCQQR
jgi:hypothetical protein